jgi:hypothetical protein
LRAGTPGAEKIAVVLKGNAPVALSSPAIW